MTNYSGFFLGLPAGMIIGAAILSTSIKIGQYRAEQEFIEAKKETCRDVPEDMHYACMNKLNICNHTKIEVNNEL